jgi:hypothetical protein
VLLFCLLLVPGLDNKADESKDDLAKQMLPIYAREAAEYSIAVESAPKKPLELKKEAVFEWTNPVREGVQQGAVFLWLRDGKPAAIGDFFSEPEGMLKGRKVMHEFHALDTEKLIVTRPEGSLNEWKPETGLERKVLADSPAPATTPAARLLQMRKLAQEFTGYETDDKEKRWDLRLLPAPLYRYPTAKSGVIDGALFTLVSTAGTDPEVLLLIEAKEDAGGKMHWDYALGRYSDRNLYVQRNDKDIWSLVRSDTNTFLHDPQHLFRVYPDKVVNLEGKLLARVRATEEKWWGEFFPVKDK